MYSKETKPICSAHSVEYVFMCYIHQSNSDEQSLYRKTIKRINVGGGEMIQLLPDIMKCLKKTKFIKNRDLPRRKRDISCLKC